MRRVPALVATRANGSRLEIPYRTLGRAERDAAMVRHNFPDIRVEWIDSPTLWDVLKGIWAKKRATRR